MRMKCPLHVTCLLVLSSIVNYGNASAAVLPGGMIGDEQTSIGYDPLTGELSVDAPINVELTSIHIKSTDSIFDADPAQNLTLPPSGFDIDDDDVIFKSSMISGSFSSLSFGNVAQPGLSQAFVLNDLDVVGSLDGGGDLGPVDLIYVVPEPSTAVLFLFGVVAFGLWRSRSRRLSDTIGDK